MQNLGVGTDSQELETNLIDSTPQFQANLNLGEQLALSFSQINNFEEQIKYLESELATEENKQQLQDIELGGSHFYFKKNQGKVNRGQININMEFLDDKVFNNIEDKYMEQMQKMFDQAKAQITRLENLLIQRDNFIVNLNQEINKLNQINSNVANQNSQFIAFKSSPSTTDKYHSIDNTQHNNLLKAFSILKQQYNSLKTDNLLLFQDIKVLKQQLDKVTQISQFQDITNKKLLQQKNKLIFDKNNYLLSLQELRNNLNKQKQTNLLSNKKIKDLYQQIKQLKYDKNQLQLQLTQTKQTNPQIIRSNSSQQLRKEIERLKDQKLISSNNQQQLRRQINFLRSHKQTTNNKITQLQNKLLTVEENSKKYQNIIQRAQIENQHIKNINNSLTIDYQSIKHKLQSLNTQLKNKNNLILELQNKLQYTQKKQPIKNRQYESIKHNDSGMATNRKLNFESPSKMLTIQTPQQLIQYSRDILRQGLIINNLSKLHSALDLTTNQLEIARRQLQKIKMLRQESNTVSNFTIFKNQTEAYIQTLLNTISQHQLEKQKYNIQIQQIRSKNMGNQQLINDLNQQKRLTQYLSDRIKTVEEELFELTRELNAKNEQIYGLETRLNRHRGQSFDVDDKLGKVKYQYSQINHNSYEMRMMMEETNMYKLELEKAIHLNQKLREYISKPSKFSCNQCQQYLLANQDLQKRLQKYQGTIGEYQRIFKSQEKPTVNKGRILLKTKVNNLKDRTNDSAKRHGIDLCLHNQLYESKKARSSEKIKLSTRTVHKKHTVLDHLVESEKLSFETLLILMLKIVVEADNQKLFHSEYSILPQHIEILDYDRFHPDNIKVQLAESRQSSPASKLSLYLAPQRLRNCQPTRKSLVWNIGLIFDFMIHKQPYFKSQSEIVNNNISYRFQNKQFPRLKNIVCSMLQKEISKRKMFADIKTMISAELVGLQKLRGREDR